MNSRRRLGMPSDMSRTSMVMWQQDGRGYCFEGIARATEAAVATVEQQGSGWVRPWRNEHRA